jgi:hypothetical protein
MVFLKKYPSASKYFIFSLLIAFPLLHFTSQIMNTSIPVSSEIGELILLGQGEASGMYNLIPARYIFTGLSWLAFTSIIGTTIFILMRFKSSAIVKGILLTTVLSFLPLILLAITIPKAVLGLAALTWAVCGILLYVLEEKTIFLFVGGMTLAISLFTQHLSWVIALSQAISLPLLVHRQDELLAIYIVYFFPSIALYGAYMYLQSIFGGGLDFFPALVQIPSASNFILYSIGITLALFGLKYFLAPNMRKISLILCCTWAFSWFFVDSGNILDWLFLITLAVMWFIVLFSFSTPKKKTAVILFVLFAVAQTILALRLLALNSYWILHQLESQLSAIYSNFCI